MPSLRGLEVGVISTPEVHRLPEFPHPDAGSVKLPRLDNFGQFHLTRSFRQPKDHRGSDGEIDPTRLPKGNPVTSVYIPSVPGTQFWIKYWVHQPPPPPTHLFFKMYMNGRHIMSWGMDPATNPTGRVLKALYQPGEQYHYTEGNETFRSEGIEERYFYFTPGYEKKSVAEDGGLIEVQVFRAKTKTRRAAELQQYKNQAHYGIMSPSGGLLENPQATTFYTWFLEDPKDSPYATFRFHYRSWANLSDLNLIPSFHKKGLAASPSGITLTPGANAGYSELSTDIEACQFSFGFESSDATVFEESLPEEKTTEASDGGSCESLYVLKSPPEWLPVAPASHHGPHLNETSRDVMESNHFLQRPLPDLPVRYSSSATSRPPSITPSLQLYADDESFESTNAELGVADLQVFKRSESKGLIIEGGKVLNEMNGDDDSGSDYEVSLAYTNESHSSQLLSPGNYIPTTGSTLDRHIAQFNSPYSNQHSVELDVPVSRYDSSTGFGRGLGVPRVTALRSGEIEWMRRTPSPVNRGLTQTHNRMWSPRPARRPPPLIGTSRFENVCETAQKKAGNGDQENVAPLQYPDESKERYGNWI